MASERQAAVLINRGVIKVSGPEARPLLDRLVTGSLAAVSPGVGAHAALLTPQGKVIADFFVIDAEEDGTAVFLDAPLVAMADLIKRLTLYKLRADVTITDMSADLAVVALWGGEPVDDLAACIVDPRHAQAGQRVVADRSQVSALCDAVDAALRDAQSWHDHRVRLGLGEAVLDYPLNDTFPHEINMDQLGGIDFAKGCYVGQEVVSRMQHRGTARTRLVPVRLRDGIAVLPGSLVLAGEKQAGTIGSNSGGLGVALLRLDRIADAMAAGEEIRAGGVLAEILRPDWWKAPWPLDSDQ